MGTAIDELGKGFWQIIDPLFAGEDLEIPEGDPQRSEEFFEKIPFLTDDETLKPIQAAAQPCFLDEGTADFSDIDKPCPKREQPASERAEEEPPDGEGQGEEAEPESINVDGGKFDGSGGFHSTGLDDNTGDTFSRTFTKPGTYLFACLVHPAMVGKVVVK